MDPSEIEFIAEQENISIIPKFSDSRIVHLISGDIGPFRAGIPVVVPLWVALNLRQRQKCTIVAPDWMDIEVLEQKIEEEKNSRVFTRMPSNHYMGICHMLLRVAPEDVKDSDKIRTAVKDLWDLRVAKARSSADSFLKGGGRHAGIDHITPLELCTLRPLLLDALDAVYFLNVPREQLQLNNTTMTSQSFSSSIN